MTKTKHANKNTKQHTKVDNEAVEEKMPATLYLGCAVVTEKDGSKTLKLHVDEVRDKKFYAMLKEKFSDKKTLCRKTVFYVKSEEDLKRLKEHLFALYYTKRLYR